VIGHPSLTLGNARAERTRNPNPTRKRGMRRWSVIPRLRVGLGCGVVIPRLRVGLGCGVDIPRLRVGLGCGVVIPRSRVGLGLVWLIQFICLDHRSCTPRPLRGIVGSRPSGCFLARPTNSFGQAWIFLSTGEYTTL